MPVFSSFDEKKFADYTLFIKPVMKKSNIDVLIAEKGTDGESVCQKSL